MPNRLFPLWVIIDVLVLLAATSLWIVAPEYRTLNFSLTAFALSLGLLLAFLRWQEIQQFLQTRYFKQMLYHAINVVLVFSILSLLNYLGNKNYREFDITSAKRNSLTEQSRKVLEMVDAPLQFTVFSRREEWMGILTLLRLYEAQSRHVKLQAIDTDVRPDLVKEKSINENGTVLIDYMGRQSRFKIQDELSVTNALLRILRTEEIVIYIVTGHGELSCQEQGQEGISHLCQQIEAQNYQIRQLDLTRTKEVPRDASAVLVPGPVRGFLDQEAQQLGNYLQRGGNLLLALAPSFAADIYANLTTLAKPYGLSLGRDIVIDRLSTIQGAEATIPIVNKYDEHHPVTAGFNQRTIFPLSASVNLIPGKDNANLLAFTSDFPASWAETDLKAVTEGKAEYKEGVDQKGPVALLGIGEASQGGRDSRLVLLGSSSFLINAYQTQSANSVLLLNTLSWLVNDEGIISFNRPGQEEHPVILSAQHLNMIFMISILLVPIVFFGTGIYVYRRRRLL
jgi:ABC-type uncharacterized transport system involved in gliding motility auxiliary subunit